MSCSRIARAAIVCFGLGLLTLITGLFVLKRPAPPSAALSVTTPVRVQQSYRRPPLTFEINEGQAGDERVQFLGRGRSANFFVTPKGIICGLKPKRGGKAGPVFEMEWVDALKSIPSGLEELPGTVNYFVGNNPHQWRTGIRTFAKVESRGIYPGVNVVLHGESGQFEYDFVLAPSADTSKLRLAFKGIDDLRVDSAGDLVLRVGDEDIRQKHPNIYARGDLAQQRVESQYVLTGPNEVALLIGPRDTRLTWVIDPVMVFSSYLGGSDTDSTGAIALDSTGNVYVAGTTISPNFPTASPRQGTLAGGFDAFVTKFNATGSALVYSTYLGGGGPDVATGIAVDSSGNAFVTGYTKSTNFPVSSPLPGLDHLGGAGAQNAFVTKLSSSGSALLYSTYLGGSGSDTAYGIAIDGSGNAYIAGSTTSTNFPMASAYQSTNRGFSDAFITKLNPSGSALVYSTYLGGALSESANAIAVDTTGNAYVAGNTTSTDFPTANALQPALAGGADAFIAKLSASGSALVYSTFLGGSTHDFAYGLVIDSSGSAVVGGSTISSDFPTTALPIQSALAGGSDGWVAKLNPGGSSLIYSTYLGGNASDVVNGVAIDNAGNVYLTGETQSQNFPVVLPLQAAGGAKDAFLAMVNPAGTALVYSTFLGGADNDSGRAVAAGLSGTAYITGATSSTDFPTLHPLQSATGGGEDVFVAAIGSSSAIAVAAITPSSGTTAGGTDVALSGANFLPGASVTIGGASANSIVVVAGGRITAKTPAHARGTVDVVVANPSDGGIATLSPGFTYQDNGQTNQGGKSGCTASAGPFSWLAMLVVAVGFGQRLFRKLD